MKKAGILLLLLSMPFLASAQQRTLVGNLEQDEDGKGRVRIEMDERLDSLLGTCHTDQGEGTVKAIGFRIQVYAGNNTRTSKEKATETEQYIRENFPEYPVYTVFKSPRWQCVVGDFLYFEEAYETMLKFRRDSHFKQMLILRNQEIKVPL